MRITLFNRVGRYSRKVGTITFTQGDDFARWEPNVHGPIAKKSQREAVERYCDRRMRPAFTRALEELTDAFDEVRIIKLDK